MVDAKGRTMAEVGEVFGISGEVGNLHVRRAGNASRFGGRTNPPGETRSHGGYEYQNRRGKR
jgi:hypothetical protein